MKRLALTIATLTLASAAIAGPAGTVERTAASGISEGMTAPGRDPLPAGKVTLGVYDPHRAFSSDRDVGIEHIFVYWQALDVEKFRTDLAYAERRNRTMMVTVEPYTRASNWRDGGDHLFSDIVEGKFRPEIERVCGELGRFKGPVLVRWGHEMEDASGRYPWARRDFEGYKAAFRHFVTTCRTFAPNASFVWSPKGEKRLVRYYPGDAYVDYVGLSVWGLQKMDIDYFGHGRRFESTFAGKYERVAGFAKPVIIAELGVSGDRPYRRDWFEDLYKSITRSPAFSRLRAVVYFNDKEPYHWPMGYGSPDWRIGEDWFSRAKQVAQNG